ncbi:MAG: WD40 repeat domain-containing protein [Chloroflexi bacterium]|nr:WD40 repeat domain-containing protein [Chloroflexota bacterium]
MTERSPLPAIIGLLAVFALLAFLALNTAPRTDDVRIADSLRTGDPEGPLASFDLPTGATALAWSPGGERIAVALDTGGVLVHNLTTGSVETRVAGRTSVLAWSPGGAYLAVGGTAPTVYNTQTWEPAIELPFTLDDQPVSEFAWSPDGGRLAVGGILTETITIWDVPNAAITHRLDTEIGLTAMNWPNPLTLRAGYALQEGVINVWEFKDENTTVTNTLNFGAFPLFFTFSPAGDYFIASEARIVGRQPVPDEFSLREAGRPTLGEQLPLCFEGPLGPLVWSPEGSRFAIGDRAAAFFGRENRALIAIYDREAGECFTLETASSDLLAFSPGGTLIAASGETVESVVIFRAEPAVRVAMR